jgi:hypothetical protein
MTKEALKLAIEELDDLLREEPSFPYINADGEKTAARYGGLGEVAYQEACREWIYEHGPAIREALAATSPPEKPLTPEQLSLQALLADDRAMWKEVEAKAYRDSQMNVGKLISQPGQYLAQPEREPLTREIVSAIARRLSDSRAETCGVDKDDQWMIYGEDFIADVDETLAAARGISWSAA